jgi:mono/diheme cytochrome c family protein
MHYLLRTGLLVGAVTFALGASALAQSTVDAGREVYAEHCAECHGERLVETGAAPDLKLLRADQRALFDQTVRDGRGQMPAWGSLLSDEQIDQIWAYIRSRASN